jgi:hypothetical protein
MVRDESPDASAEATWKKTSGNDHFFHSMAFNLLARRICEHMYQTQNGTPGFSASIGGVAIGGLSKLPGLVAAPTDQSKQLRVSRLG